jgi:choline monooxygenase
VPLREWAPFLFCGLDPAMPFDDWLAPVRERGGWVPLETFVFDAAGSHDYLVNANWALYVDNYLEGFHIPFVHASSLGGALDYGSYDTETFDYGVLQTGVASSGEPAFDLPDDHPDAGTRMAAHYVRLFPNLMLNVYPWGLSLNVVRPLGPERTKVSFLYFVGDEALRDQGAGADLDRVEMEDEEIVEQVQRGVRSRLYDRGRYSPTREKGPHHFHRLLARFLFEDGRRPTADGSNEDD